MDDSQKLQLKKIKEFPIVGIGAAANTNDSTKKLSSGSEDELERVRAHLHSTIEQFEIEQEKLRAANQELRSSAEELETGKEELQSINEALTTINQELKIKIEMLCQSNDDFHNLMAATDIGTIFLDRDLQIKFYTPPALKVFNITAADIGRPLEHITHRLECKNLAADALEVMNISQTLKREAQSDDGKYYVVHIVPYHNSEERIDGVMLTFVDFTERKNVEFELVVANSQIKLQAKTFDTTLSNITDFTYTFDRDGRFILANRPLLELWGIRLEDAVGKNFCELGYPDDLAKRLEREIQQVIDTKQNFKGETSYISPGGFDGYYEYIFNPIFADDGTVESVAGSTRDITTRKRLENNLAFAAEISRDLTILSDIDEIMRNVGAKIGAYLHLSNCALIEVNEIEDAAVINHAWHRPNAVEMRGVYHFSEYLSDEFQKAGRAGQNFIVNDTRNDSRVDVAACAQFKIGAMLGVPVVENDEWRFMLLVYHNVPHVWQTDEIELMNDLTKRIRRRLERARSDEALRESEEKYRQLFNSIDEGFAIIEMIFDNDDKPVNYLFLETNPAFEKQTGLIRVIGKTSLEIMPNLENFWFEIFGKVALTGESMRFESETIMINRTFDIFASRVGDSASRKVAVVFRDITERKQHEKDQRQLLRKLVTTQEDERRRISRELHDHFGQNLTALRINLESLRKQPTDDDKLREKIELIQKIAVRLDAQIDFLAWELRPAALDDLGLAAALDNFTNEWSAQSGVPVKFHTTGFETIRLSSDVEINLYRIVQEALNNVNKHAVAARVNVILERRDDHLSLIIEDNGAGFNPKSKRRAKRKSLGIVGMRERAALLGGTLEVESKVKRGTTVFVRIPL